VLDAEVAAAAAADRDQRRDDVRASAYAVIDSRLIFPEKQPLAASRSAVARFAEQDFAEVAAGLLQENRLHVWFRKRAGGTERRDVALENGNDFVNVGHDREPHIAQGAGGACEDDVD
jgi:hypothetical protein